MPGGMKKTARAKKKKSKVFTILMIITLIAIRLASVFLGMEAVDGNTTLEAMLMKPLFWASFSLETTWAVGASLMASRLSPSEHIQGSSSLL